MRNLTKQKQKRQVTPSFAAKKRRKRPPSYPNHRYLLPENFVVPVELPELLSGRIEEGLWILHLLFGRKFYDARRIDPERWYRLNFKKLRKTVHWSRVSAWIEFWLFSGVIERGGDGYAVGVRSRRYRMTAKYRLQTGKNYQLKDMRMRKKITEYQNEKKFLHDDPLYRKLEACLRAISIRKQDAIDFVNHEKDYKSSGVKDEDYARAVDLSCIEMLASPHRNFFVDRYGRVHTNLTNLSRELRQFLYLKKDDDFISLTDVMNSQAFIYSLLLRKLERIASGDELNEKQELMSKVLKYTEEGIEEDKLNRKIKEKREGYVGTRERGKKEGREREEPGKEGTKAEREEPSCVTKCAPKQHLTPLTKKTCGRIRDFLGDASCCDEKTCDDTKMQKAIQKCIAGFDLAVGVASVPGRFESYIGSCCKGLLYEELSESLPEGHEYKKMPRKDFKKRFFKESIFCKSRYAENRPLRDVFAGLHPDVWKVTCLLKSGHHAVLPKLLQNIESEYVIAVAARNFARKHPKAFLATVHDSLMIPSRYREDASEALIGAFKEAGLSPSVSTETMTWY